MRGVGHPQRMREVDVDGDLGRGLGLHALKYGTSDPSRPVATAPGPPPDGRPEGLALADAVS